VLSPERVTVRWDNSTLSLRDLAMRMYGYQDMKLDSCRNSYEWDGVEAVSWTVYRNANCTRSVVATLGWREEPFIFCKNGCMLRYSNNRRW
jgi:hypothetical protein